MKLSDNNKRIFAPTGCLEKDAMLDYLAGKTDAAQKRAIELHLADCPLCSDALDGLSLLEAPEKIDGLLAETKLRLSGPPAEEYVLNTATGKPSERRLQKLVFIGIAASLALLVISFLSVRFLGMSDQKQETLSYENTPTKAESSEGKADAASEKKAAIETPVKQEDISVVTGTGQKGVPTPVVSGEWISYAEQDKNKEAQEEQYDMIADYSGHIDGLFSKTDDAEDARTENKLAELEKDVDQDQQNLAGDEKTVSVTTIVSEESVSRRSGKKENTKNTGPAITGGVVQNADVPAQAQQPQRGLNNGMDAFQKGDYAGAADRFDEALSLDPGQTQALYYKGLSHYYLREYNEALKSLQKIMDDKKSPYYEAAQWQIAVIYMETGDARKARKTLNEVIDGNGSYRNPAEEAIKNLGDQ